MTPPYPRLYLSTCPTHRAVIAPVKLTTCPYPACGLTLNKLHAADLPARWQGVVTRYRKRREHQVQRARAQEKQAKEKKEMFT